MALRLLTVLFVSAVVLGMAAAFGRPGGLSQEKDVTPDVQAIIDTVRPEVEKQLGFPVSQFKGIKYKSQVVAGINYFVKVDIGNDEYVHIRVYQTLNRDVSLHSMEYPKAVDHPITYF